MKRRTTHGRLTAASAPGTYAVVVDLDRTITSLYRINAVATGCPESRSSREPGTRLTASIETVDNDRAAALLAVGVLR